MFIRKEPSDPSSIISQGLILIRKFVSIILPLLIVGIIQISYPIYCFSFHIMGRVKYSDFIGPTVF